MYGSDIVQGTGYVEPLTYNLTQFIVFYLSVSDPRFSFPSELIQFELF
jgi:hypothetical protein